MTPPDQSVAEQLCLSCGLCCNGVIFRDVELQPKDILRLKSVGLPIKQTKTKSRLLQPCAALECSTCKIYSARPNYCREFECALFKRTMSGRITSVAALRIVRRAQKHAEKVYRLLRELGNTDEHLALSRRFKQLSKQFESGALTRETAGLYGELTIAFHELNFLLSSAFYPGTD